MKLHHFDFCSMSENTKFMTFLVFSELELEVLRREPMAYYDLMDEEA